MMNKKKLSFFVILLALINLKSFSNEGVYVVYNVNNQIIGLQCEGCFI